MNRRASVFVVAFLLAALAGVALLAIPGSPFERKPTLGLDLQGGLEVTLKAKPPPDRELTREDLERSVEIMRSRVDKLGVAEPEIRTQGDDQIVIQLPGVRNPEAAAEVIGTTAQLELYDLEVSLVGPSLSVQGFPVEHTSLYELLAKVQARARDGGPAAYYVVDPRRKRVVGGPFGSPAEARRELHGRLPRGTKLFTVPKGMVVVTCGESAVVCPGGPQGSGLPPDRTYYYLFRYDPPRIPQLTGEDFKLDGTRADYDPRTGQPIVTMEFTDRGGDKFEEVTRLLWVRGNTRKAPQHFAIVLDREIRTFPQIDYTDASLAGGIGGGRAQIEGLESFDEAREIAIVLQTGALPVEFETLDRTDISATLGKDSLREAYRAAIGGLVLVVLFLLLFYRFLGVVAVLGLGIYAAFIYATVLLFNVTLTLPGFAGLVLTFGVAADANIVIFERIKEEVRAGRSMRAAIAAGYRKGFATIVDANVVTAITAMVLFVVATASVRGFALMLLIGTALSLLTAVLATRAILALLSGVGWLDNPRVMGATGEGLPRWLRLDYVGRRRLWFGFSAAVLALCLGAIVLKGLNLGIDFKGGTEIDFRTPQPTSLETIRAETAKIGQANAVIQGRGDAVNGRYRSFQIRTEALSTAEQNRLQQELTRAVDATSFGSKNVSESFGRQIANAAIRAIVVSLLLMVVYISVRFQWKYSVGVLVALAHDLLIAVGIYALTGREVSTATVAALLTILGYSMYDTIIIFDRIRENIPLMRRASIRVIGNVSLWEVIPRSLATTFITLLPVAALYWFGGDTLKDFAFALLVGIGSGSYSSIFLAAPLLAVLKEREPDFLRRRDDLGALAGVPSVGATLKAEAEAVAAQGDGQPEESAEPPRAPVGAGAGPGAGAGKPAAPSSRRERRRQRRSSRPHGRAR
ncbi:MAG TPA: protein translocase subunit SecD [Gaiellaceae bacterium]|nr:protein translocase subunit SecD [Gaiellaceae bacterium]